MKYTKSMLNKLLITKKYITDVTNRSHFRKQYTELEGKGLSPAQILMLTYIYDTMELSWTNDDQYYDKKRHNYYAVVTRKTMTEKYGIKNSAVGNNLQFLEDSGYIKKIHSFNGGVRVFVYHFSYEKSETVESGVSKRQNLTSNQTHFNHTHNITSDTSSVSSSKDNNHIVVKSNNRFSTKEIKKHKEFEKNSQLDALKKGLLNVHVPAKAVKYAFKFYNSYKTIHDKIFATLFKAKKKAEKMAIQKPADIYTEFKYGKFYGNKNDVNRSFYFEDNEFIYNELSEEFRKNVFKAEHESKYFCKYLYTCFYNFFIKASQKYITKLNMQLEPDIPIFKI